MLTPKAGEHLSKFKHQNIFIIFYCFLENNLLKNLPVNKQCTPKEADFLRYIYATKLSKVNNSINFHNLTFFKLFKPIILKPNKQTTIMEQHQECQQIFKENLDIMVNKAERLYYDGDFESAYAICRK